MCQRGMGGGGRESDQVIETLGKGGLWIENRA